MNPIAFSGLKSALPAALLLGSGLLHAFLASGSLLSSATVKPSSGQVTAVSGADPNRPMVAVKVAAGSDNYPGIAIKPTAGHWDLSKSGHVEATVKNTGTKPLLIALRVDNAGNWQDNPWDTEQVTIAPGATEVVETRFGYSYGFKKGFELNPSAVVNLLIFTGKTDSPESFEVLALRAAGAPHESPPVNSADVTTKPREGMMFGPGAPTASVRLDSAANPRTIQVAPETGRWDLSDFTDVRVTVRNVGSAPVRPEVRLETKGGNSETVIAPKEVPPGASAEIEIPFAHLIDLNQQGTQGQITSDAVTDVAVKDDRVHVESIRAIRKTADVPKWLGQRPPVAGDWVKTLDDEFDGAALNRKVWSDSGENYYDKVTHWSKSDVIVGDGVARLRYEKKTGFQNDDPKRNSTAYAAGYLDSYGLWTQRYGYFEARMKLPRSPGLWPAFWMMPDRGATAGDHGARQDTSNGGMEFDVMEHLTRWGPYRYNIAMHWDGYEKNHKAIGSEHIYVHPDKDGYLTCGLLWTPGEVVYYCNGVEVLRWKSPRISNVPETIMFTLPSGGWDNNALDDARLPDDLVIDYVRVWQRRDLMSAGR